MENPYAQAAAPAPATPEQQKLVDYELASARTRTTTSRSSSGSTTTSRWLGWHWPAFFVTSAWYLYRKMWLWGIVEPGVCFFMPDHRGRWSSASRWAKLPKAKKLPSIGVGFIIGR